MFEITFISNTKFPYVVVVPKLVCGVVLVAVAEVTAVVVLLIVNPGAVEEGVVPKLNPEVFAAEVFVAPKLNAVEVVEVVPPGLNEDGVVGIVPPRLNPVALVIAGAAPKLKPVTTVEGTLPILNPVAGGAPPRLAAVVVVWGVAPNENPVVAEEVPPAKENPVIPGLIFKKNIKFYSK